MDYQIDVVRFTKITSMVVAQLDIEDTAVGEVVWKRSGISFFEFAVVLQCVYQLTLGTDRSSHPNIHAHINLSKGWRLDVSKHFGSITSHRFGLHSHTRTSWIYRCIRSRF